MSLAFSTVATAISRLSTPVPIRDITDIPPAVAARDGAMVIPLPGFVTDFSVVRDSFGGGSTAKMTVTYTMNYRLLYAPAASDRIPLELLDNMFLAVAGVLDEILAIDVLSGAVDIMPLAVTNMGIVNDPSDTPFYGCDMAIQVTEFVN